MNQFVEIEELAEIQSHNQDNKINNQPQLPNYYLQLQSDKSSKHKEIAFEENNSPQVLEQKIEENASKFKLVLPSSAQVDAPQERNNTVKPKRVLVEPHKVTTISKSRTTEQLRIFDIDDDIEEQIRQTIPSATVDQPVKVAFKQEETFRPYIHEIEQQNNSFLEVNHKTDVNQMTTIETVKHPEPKETKNTQIDTDHKSRFFKHSKIEIKQQKVTKGAFFQKNHIQPDEYIFVVAQSPSKKSLESGMQATSVQTSRDELSTREILPPTFGSKRYKLPELKPYKQALEKMANQATIPSQNLLKEEPEPKIMVQQKPFVPWSRQVVIAGREILNVSQFVRNPVPYGKRLQCELVRNKSCSSRYFLDYDLITNDGKFLMSCKKMAFCFNSTYNISLANGSYDEKSDFFLGKSQGNFVGSIFNIYSSNNDSFQQLNMVATIFYASSFSCCSENCREMEIYLISDQYKYYELEGTELQRGKNLKELYEVEGNRTLKRITKYVNKKPKWIPQREIYALGFHGKSRMGSVKNAIIIEENNPSNELLLIAKKDTNQFVFDICYPFSPLVAFGVMITGFDFKLATQ